MRTLAPLLALVLLAPGLAAAQEVAADAPVATALQAAPAPLPVPAVAPPPAAPSIDAIGALIDQQEAAEEIDEETAETMASPEPERAPRVIAPNAGYTPSYTRPNRSGLDRPVMLHETGLSPDGPPDVNELTYESRVRGSIAAAQGLQGPLDGAWTLSDAGGGKLYAFQMVDPGVGLGDLEGAWRDLRRGEGIGAVGLIAAVERVESGLTVRFYPRDAGEPVVAQLTPTAAGGWSGKLTERGTSSDVTLVRDGPAPVSYAVMGASSGYTSVRPYDPTPRAAPVRKASSKATKGKKSKKVAAKKGAKKKAVAKKSTAKKPALRTKKKT